MLGPAIFNVLINDLEMKLYSTGTTVMNSEEIKCKEPGLNIYKGLIQSLLKSVERLSLKPQRSGP